jgi:phosphoribosylformylglycinamidine cyclo-ligase
VSEDEMDKVFNMGLGMIAVVPAKDAFKAIEVLRLNGHRAVEIGEIVDGHGEVRLT